MSSKVGHHQTREEMIREILKDNVSILGDYSDDDSEVAVEPVLVGSNNSPKVMSSILSVSFNDSPRVSFSSEPSSPSPSSRSAFPHPDTTEKKSLSAGAVKLDGNSFTEPALRLLSSHRQREETSEVANKDETPPSLVSLQKQSFATNDLVVSRDSSSSSSISSSLESQSSSSHQISMSSQPQISEGEEEQEQQQLQHQNDDNSASSPILLLPQNNNKQSRSKQATGMSVRCHCNLASCVTNNYMCKSERRVAEDGKELEAGCFVQELENESSTQSQQHGVSVPMWNGRVATARRGCIEMLSREKQEKCSDRAGDQVHCCTQDMCNYPKSFYPSPLHNLNSNRPTFDSSSSSSGIRGIAGMTPNLDHQVWLRAAVIAVPICGLMILVVLIVVARRLLQSDDYKDGRPYRRKTSSSTTVPPHHPYQHHQFLPPTIVHGGQRSPYAQDGFHVKPVYMETSEYLLPPSYCTNCQQPHSTNSQPRSSTSSYSHENCRKNSNNSETEQLVHSHGSSSSSNNSNHCHCADAHQLSDDAGDAHHHTRSFSWNSIQPPVLSGSSPELPAIHVNPENNHPNRKLNFLTKLGLSRSTQSDNNPLNTRPYNV